VAERSERGRQVERSDLDRPDRPGQSRLEEGLATAGEPDPERLGPVGDLLAADPLERPDRGDVQ